MHKWNHIYEIERKRYEIQLTTEVTVNVNNQIFPDNFILIHLFCLFIFSY